ncbi:MAG TPA: selenocysteine-specific translation elongation factor [Ramlibacter sp.]|nr:selenocysteine-specific translation elongation factor [Ramlibacter sp.]
MIVATAGHIDHGKTTLVKALTGVDTDRLPQEKARGISIDLGFAYRREPGGSVIAFVDVPGHERFVRNMLAGVCAIDFALLVVAADDGVMPQTREHLAIVDLLGLRHGVAVVTKADRVDAARVAQVGDEVRALLAGTGLHDAPLLPVSATTGAGIGALQDLLSRAAASLRRGAATGRRFRLAVDRSFTVAGSGTVVTGTVFDGSVRVGDKVLLSPSGVEVRVRGLQKDGGKAEGAVAGERCALNLVGVERGQVQRGDWVLHPQLHAPTARLDVQLQVLPGEAQALRHWTPVHLHLGTRDVTARVALRRGESVAAGTRAAARLVVDQPIVALHGDRFILRDQSAQRTLGGGVVLDAFPPARRAPLAVREQRAQAFAAGTPAQVLAALVAGTLSGVDAHVFSRNFNLDDAAFAALLQQAGCALVGSGAAARVVTQASAQAAQVRAAPAAEPENPEHVRLWQLAEPHLRRAARGGLSVAQLAEAIRAKEPVLRDALHRKAKAGQAVRVTDDRFFLRETIDDFIGVARRTAATVPEGRFTAAQFRDHAGIGRSLAIQVLESLDRLGATRRIGDVRVLAAAAAPNERVPS